CLCMEARPLFEALEEPHGLAGTLAWLARIAFIRGDRRAGRQLLEERLVICRKLGEAERPSRAPGWMGHLWRGQGGQGRGGAGGAALGGGWAGGRAVSWEDAVASALSPADGGRT